LYLIASLGHGIVNVALTIPHATFEQWLLSQREPFSSFDLFWVPAFLFTSLGTLWHYYWPQLLRWIMRRAQITRA
jgi:hypothetical protein